MKKIGFSGTLDPITNGHMWVINEARSIADEVVVFLSENTAKKPKFTAEERKSIIALSCAEQGWDNVQVVIVKGDYTARAAKKHGADCLIRGIRTTADFDYENLIQQTNVDVLQGAKTIFVMPPRDLGSVSSSFVKALEGPIGWNWIMKKFVPGPAYHAWVLSWLRKEWETLWDYAHADVPAIAHADQWFVRLTGATAYGGADRHYHNLDHLVHGLCEIRAWAANTGPDPLDVDLVKQAFWFHDAEYGHHGGPGELTNEEASAQLWLGSHLAQEMDDTAQLIRATDHFRKPRSRTGSRTSCSASIWPSSARTTRSIKTTRAASGANTATCRTSNTARTGAARWPICAARPRPASCSATPTSPTPTTSAPSTTCSAKWPP